MPRTRSMKASTSPASQDESDSSETKQTAARNASDEDSFLALLSSTEPPPAPQPSSHKRSGSASDAAADRNQSARGAAASQQQSMSNSSSPAASPPHATPSASSLQSQKLSSHQDSIQAAEQQHKKLIAAHPPLRSLLDKIPAERHFHVLQLYTQLQEGRISEAQFVEECKIATSSGNSRTSSGALDSTSQKRPLDMNSSIASKRARTDHIVPVQTSGVITSAALSAAQILASAAASMSSNQGKPPQSAGLLSNHPRWMSNAASSASGNASRRNTLPSNAFAAGGSMSAQNGIVTGVSLPTNTSSSRNTSGSQSRSQKAEVDVTKMDVDTMMDVTNYAGVDLGEEEYSLNDVLASHSSMPPPSQYASFREQNLLHLSVVRQLLEKKAKARGFSATPDPLLAELVSHATQTYMVALLYRMRSIAHHRSGADMEEFLRTERAVLSNNRIRLDVVPVNDARSVLANIEEQERAEEERMTSLLGPLPNEEEGEPDIAAVASAAAADVANPADAVAGSNGSAPAAGSGGDAIDASAATQNQTKDAPNASKDAAAAGSANASNAAQNDTSQSSQSAQKGDRKKPTKRVTKREMPEAVKNRLVNKTALLAAGGSLKSWMLPGGAAGAAGGGPSMLRVASTTKSVATSNAKPSTTGESNEENPQPTETNASTASTAATNAVDSSAAMASIQRAARRIMLKDALFALEQEPSMRKSALLYKWLSNIK